MSRIDALRKLLEKDPRDGMSRYMLANELFRAQEYAEAVDHLEHYVQDASDEGAAYRILADAYLQLGKHDEAKWALRQGASAARSHHHDGMAEELEDRLAELDKDP